MRFNQLLVSDEIRQQVVERYCGIPLGESDMTTYHQFAFQVYDNPAFIDDPRIQATFQIDITSIYKNYQRHYQSMPAATFTTFVKWLIIKAQYNTPFIWRKINGGWFKFSNLPLEVTMRTGVRRQLSMFVLNDVTDTSWQSFCDKHAEYKSGKLKDLLMVDLGLPMHWLAYQMIGVHLPRMTSYNITSRIIYAHQPWFVFGERYEQNGTIYLPFYLNYSHATLTPEDAELFVKQFVSYGNMTPHEVELAHNTLTKININNGNDVSF